VVVGQRKLVLCLSPPTIPLGIICNIAVCGFKIGSCNSLTYGLRGDVLLLGELGDVGRV